MEWKKFWNDNDMQQIPEDKEVKHVDFQDVLAQDFGYKNMKAMKRDLRYKMGQERNNYICEKCAGDARVETFRNSSREKISRKVCMSGCGTLAAIKEKE